MFLYDFYVDFVQVLFGPSGFVKIYANLHLIINDWQLFITVWWSKLLPSKRIPMTNH